MIKNGSPIKRDMRGIRGFPGGAMVKNLTTNAGATGHASSCGSGISPAGWHNDPLQYSCLGNPTDTGDWQITVYGVPKSWT